MEDDESRSNTYHRWKTAGFALLAGAPVLAMAVMGWRWRWISDDGFINLRVVENLVHGYGPVYNIAERVEAYTSALWVGILWVGGLTGLPVEYAAVGAGLAATVLGIGFAVWGSILLRSGRRGAAQALVARRMVPLGAAVYVALPVGWTYATSGLDTGLSLFWIGFTYWASVGACLDGPGFGDRSTWYAVAMLLGLGPLVRPELGLFTLAMAVPVLWSYLRRFGGEGGAGPLLEFGAAMGAVPVAYELFRAGYFGALVPSTAIAKAAFESRWRQGLYYAEYFFELYRLYVPLGFLLAFLVRDIGDRLWRSERIEALLLAAPALTGIGYSLYIVRIGGGFMYGRLLLPGFFCLIVPVAAVALAPNGRSPRLSLERLFGAVFVLGWMVVCAGFLRMPPENQHGIGDERSWYSEQAAQARPVTEEDYRQMHFHGDGRRLREIAADRCPDDRLPAPGQSGAAACEGMVYIDELPRAKFGQLYPSRERYPLRERYRRRGVVLISVRTGIGLRGFVPGPRVHLVDRVGLADAFAARLQLESRGRPGHEKGLPAPWVVGRFSPMTLGEDPRISAARRALSCSPLRELRRSVEAPMSASRFVRNLSAAFRFHDLRIPHNPWRAEQAFCDRAPYHEELGGGEGGIFHRARCPVGYGLSRVEVASGERAGPFVRYRGRCRRLERRDGRIVAAGERIETPWLGGRTDGPTRQLSCSEGRVIVGFRGGASEVVRRLRPVCAAVTVDGRGGGSDGGEVVVGSHRPGSEVGEGGEDFEVSCPPGELAVGTAARTGRLVDAVGVSCADPLEKMEAAADARPPLDESP